MVGCALASLCRVRAVMWLELLYILRDRTSRALLAGVPALQLVLFGYAVNLDPHGVTLAISGEASPAVLDLIGEAGRFRVVASGLPPGGAERMVAGGRALVAIELPTTDAPAGEAPAGEAPAAAARVIADAADPAAVRPALAALQAAFLQRVVAADHLGGGPRIDVEWRYNPEGRTAWATVPGLAGAIVMISMLMLGALTLVREREQGTWDSLASSPAGAAEVLAGKLLPYLAFGVLQSGLIVLLAHLLFALPVRGSLPLLLLASALTAAAYLAIGFAVSAVTRTQMQAMQGAVFLYLPSMLLSGFMFPFEGMPRWAQAIGTAFPLTHFVRAARDVLLRGADGRAWTEVGWLAILAALCIAGAVTAYGWRRE
jgi:ABC-2 type transport system permease protein